MIRQSLAVRIGLAIMGLIFAVSIVQYFALGQLLRNAFYQQAGTELLAQGQQYANMSSMGGSMMMQMLGATSNAELLIITKNGRVLSATPSLHVGTPNTSDASEIQRAMSGHSGTHGGYSRLFGDTGIMAVVPITNQGQVASAVVLFRPEGAVGDAFHHVEWLLVAAGIGGLLVALGLTVILSKRIAEPLRNMASVAREMSHGDYTAEVPVTGDDEVARLGTAINELATTLHHLDTSRKEFLADVAHELRTPISYIRGYSQVLDEGLVTSPEETQSYLRIIHDETQRLESLINDLFTLAQADAHMLQIEKQPVDLTKIVESVVEKIRQKAQEKRIDLRFAMATVPLVQADDARMEQVIVNLIDNAIRYTPEKGSISVRLKGLDHMVEIEIADTGIGIPKADLPFIWDRLYRVEKSRSRARGGTGLGLTIVKQIVETHGGTVSVQSIEHKGTTISVQIPVSDP